jgi:hypothetical protein
MTSWLVIPGDKILTFPKHPSPLALLRATRRVALFSGLRDWGLGEGKRAAPLAPPIFYPLNRRRRKELVTTLTELMAMAAAARAGLRVQPQMG